MPENRENKTVGQLRDEIYQDQKREKEDLAKSIIREQMERRDRAAETYAEERRKTDKLMEMSVEEIVKTREDWKRIYVKWPVHYGTVMGPDGKITNYDEAGIYADDSVKGKK